VRALVAAGAAGLAAAMCLAAARVAPPAVRADDPVQAARVALGRRLFYDADLSRDGTMSCGACHEQRRAFAEGNRTHPGVTGEPGRRNAMALANVGDFNVFTWADPRQRTLERQALTPLTGDHPVEMGMAGQEAELARRLRSDPCYPAAFAAAFPAAGGAITFATVTQALAAFERTLVSRDAPWDRARRGEGPPLGAEARKGEALFRSPALGCASCHAGPLFTDADRADPRASYHRLPGVAASARDRGLGEVTGRPGDDGRFRTPSLRNVALTAPYLHDGSAATLEAAIAAHFTAGARPGAEEIRALVAFLDTLTDARFVSDPRFALPKPADCRPG
jgi:cytochrome c peroxidase